MNGPHERSPRTASPLLAAITILGFGAVACDGDGPDAYGNFESTEVTVSVEATGILVRFDVAEGDRLAPGQQVGQVDTVTLTLQMAEIDAQARLATTRAEEAAANLRALEAQLRVAREDYDRTRRLFESQAATAAERTRLEGTVSSLQEQVAAARIRVRLARQEVETVAVRRAQLQDRMERARVVNPIGGTVLATYAEAGEFVQPGRALYTVAPLDTLVLRAYVSGSQLAAVDLGGTATVQFDDGTGGLARREARVTWVSPVAEFTPTPIQTREERVDQVYAVKLTVPNPDGALKIGMPGEVIFTQGGSGDAGS